jgi:hypothetical protein
LLLYRRLTDPDIEMPRIILDFDPSQPDAPDFTGDTSELVYFLSWAFSGRYYGGNHEMSIAALVLRGEFKVDLSPLLRFADRKVEMEADAQELERAWQDAAPLAECCEAIVRALESDDKRLAELREDYPGLQAQIDALGQIASWAAGHRARIRVTFDLEVES